MGELPGSVNISDGNAILWESIREIGDKLVHFLPNLINALYILLIGWFVAFVVKLIFSRFLKFINFDKIAEKTGIAGSLSENDIRTRPTEWFSRLAFWMVMLPVFVKSLFELHLGDIAGGLDFFSGFVFQSVGLLIVFILGLFLSVVLSKIIFITATNLKVKSPEAYSRVMKWAILAATILFIFHLITVPMQYVFGFLGIILVTLCITFIIAFGIGGTGWAAKMLDKISK